MKFSATPIKCIYDTEGFKVYACNVDKSQYPSIQTNNYGNVTICGSIPSLILDSEYNIDATEDKGKYGISYKINFISIKKETSGEGLRQFLLGCGLSSAQSDEICREYPNIVSLVRDGNTNEIDTSKLHNIGEVRIAVIIRKIEENFMLASVAEELGGYFDYTMIKKLYDKYHSVDEIVNKIKEEPYKCLCSISGIGFKTADMKLLKLEHKIKENLKLGKEVPFEFENDLITSQDRCISAMIYLLDENETLGNTIMKLVDIKKALDKLVPECKHHFMDICKEDSQSEKPRFHIDKNSQSIANYNTYFREKKCSEIILDAVNGNQNIWDIDVEKYRTNGDITLTDEQLKTLDMVCKNSISVLQGNAGTGKTQSTLALIKLLKDNNKNFELCSPTGKAAKILANYTHCSAQTIHRLLMYNVSDGFVMNNDNKLLTDIVIVDEISMCDLSLFYALLSAIDFTKTKLLMIGDSSQLPSVGAGNILFDIINSNRVKVNSLSKVFRYGKGGILTVATDVRQSKPYLKSDVDKKVFGDDNGYVFIATSQETMLKKVTNLYKQLIDKGYTTDDILVLSAYNKGNYGTVKINNVLQPIINKNYGSDECFEFKANIKDEEGIKFYVDDIVIETKNNYKAKLCDENYNVLYDDNFNPQITFIPNGETGRIKKIIGKMVFIQFDKLVCYDYENIKSVKLAYSISTHKSQGSQSKIIILLTPKSHTYMLNSNLLYVAITRASQKVIHFGEVRTINLAIKKKADINRNTNLINFLMADDNTTK